MNKLFYFFLSLPLCLGAYPHALFNSLDPSSVTQALAFFELYPDSREALQRVMKLLKIEEPEKASCLPYLINFHQGSFSEEEITFIESLAAHLPNRKLKGYYARSEKEVMALPSEEIDLGMALLFTQMNELEEAYYQARSYSATLDLMALQILARLPLTATAEDKIRETNRLIFEELHFRFPPQSVYAQDIDLYTFLPSVMDNHLGVCLGVTALYLALSQRLDLPLEIITPPGHIYIRLRKGEEVINIETTARGVHIPSEEYLSLNTSRLEERTLKEVIGMTHVNQASVYLYAGAFEKAARAYEKAMPYMVDDPLLTELLGYSYVLSGKEKEGKALLKKIRDYAEAHKAATDYLEGRVDESGLKAMFMRVDENRDSILEKKGQIEEILKKFPHFRDGWNQLGICWIQLNRYKEALTAWERYHRLDPKNPVVEYYLAALYGERYNFKKSWEHLKNAEALTAEMGYTPKALVTLKKELRLLSPE